MSSQPATMTAIAIARPGGPEVLVPEQRPLPEAGPGQVLVRVMAAGVNRPDVMQRRGGYPPPPGASDIPGLELAGEVVALGAGAERWRIGDRVAALVPGGGYAEFAVVHWTNALPVPSGLDMTSAAAMPETFFTVWHNVFERGGLEAGETLLVHGGSSGIGTVAIMLGAAFGATVYATAGSREKCAACENLGAARAINYREEDFVAVVKEGTQGRGADVILDMVGGQYVGRNYAAAAEDGRVVQIAFLGGSKATVDLNPLMRKRLTHTGSTLRNRPVEVKAAIARGLEQRVWPLLAAGHCRPVIDSVFPLREAAAAHARIDSGAHIGKVVLEVAPRVA